MGPGMNGSIGLTFTLWAERCWDLLSCDSDFRYWLWLPIHILASEFWVLFLPLCIWVDIAYIRKYYVVLRNKILVSVHHCFLSSFPLRFSLPHLCVFTLLYFIVTPSYHIAENEWFSISWCSYLHLGPLALEYLEVIIFYKFLLKIF